MMTETIKGIVLAMLVLILLALANGLGNMLDNI